MATTSLWFSYDAETRTHTANHNLEYKKTKKVPEPGVSSTGIWIRLGSLATPTTPTMATDDSHCTPVLELEADDRTHCAEQRPGQQTRALAVALEEDGSECHARGTAHAGDKEQRGKLLGGPVVLVFEEQRPQGVGDGNSNRLQYEQHGEEHEAGHFGIARA